jgi:hypothetical protein
MPMMRTKRKALIILLLSAAVTGAPGTALLSADDLRWPLNLQPSLTGTLGEQRGDYLHSGIDIKTGGRTGHAVHAVDGGWLHSITARALGYGNSIILNHGRLFSQYAHLDSFAEGPAALNTLVNVIRLLYGGEVDDFAFKKTRISFAKGSVIGYSGETGSGPPHLHFAMREPGGAANPLQFFKVPDTEAPVIKQLLFCIEKNGSTVKTIRVKAHGSGGVYRLADPVFLAGADEKAFVKLACYDRVAAGSRCAVNRIELFEGDKLLFGMDFDRYRWSDGGTGRFIYDKSNSVVDGISLYTYFLCRRQGNGLSRISAVDDGYLRAGETPRKFKVVASDYAGNKSSLEFALIRRSGTTASTAGEDFIRLRRHAGGVLSDDAKNFTFSVGKHSLYDEAMLKVTSAQSHAQVQFLVKSGTIMEGDSSPVYTVKPYDQVYGRSAHVSIKRPASIPREEAGNILIYRFYDHTMPAGLLTFYNARTDTFEADTPGNGNFTLLRDRKPPQCHLPATYDFVVDDGVYRKLRLSLTDDLAGVNTRSVWLFVDGEKYPAAFDYDRGWLEAKLPKSALSKGTHHLFLRFRDRANNETIVRNLLVF